MSKKWAAKLVVECPSCHATGYVELFEIQSQREAQLVEALKKVATLDPKHYDLRAIAKAALLAKINNEIA